ncbi:hypothetical protein [Absidia glauca]|uniref:Uncharacterized protein n=1 Tax=Absidia glauca TaxID=4829 RepID=A0A168SKY3_ABSGL|nr:hypothetical protein [Absidia glauca]
MAKKSIFSRMLFRSTKKTPSSEMDDQLRSSSGSSKANRSSASSISSDCSDKMFGNKKDHASDSILGASKQKQQHLLSLLKCSNSDDVDDFLAASDIPPQQRSLYSLRLYIATVQKLKRHQPFSMERQRAAYHLLSCLVVQQELDRFEPEFEIVGRKPRKTRYISTLLDTPVESIAPFRHPVLEAVKRKPFVETSHVITPSPSIYSMSTSSLVSSSSSTLTSSSASISSSTSSATSSCSFPPHKRNRSHYLFFNHHTPPNVKKSSHLWSSRSDPHLHASFVPQQPNIQRHLLNVGDMGSKILSPSEDEDNIPLAILKTRKTGVLLEPLHLC